MFGFVRPVVLHPWVQDVQKRGTVQGNWVAGGHHLACVFGPLGMRPEDGGDGARVVLTRNGKIWHGMKRTAWEQRYKTRSLGILPGRESNLAATWPSPALQPDAGRRLALCPLQFSAARLLCAVMNWRRARINSGLAESH